MAKPLVYVAGATGPPLEVTIRRKNRVVPLDDYVALPASITARIDREGATPLEKPMVVDPDPTRGIARVFWEPGDLVANGVEPATYELEVVLDDGLGSSEVTPDVFRFLVRPAIPPPAP